MGALNTDGLSKISDLHLIYFCVQDSDIASMEG